MHFTGTLLDKNAAGSLHRPQFSQSQPCSAWVRRFLTTKFAERDRVGMNIPNLFAAAAAKSSQLELLYIWGQATPESKGIIFCLLILSVVAWHRRRLSFLWTPHEVWHLIFDRDDWRSIPGYVVVNFSLPYSILRTIKMSGLSDRQKVALERFLLNQLHRKPAIQRASREYLRKYPQNMNKKNVRVGGIALNAKPTKVWYSRHALFRDGPNSLTKNGINAVIKNGRYMENRNSYFNSKYQRWSTNRGTIAPLDDKTPCPKRRVSNGQRTAVLSFCYPRNFRSFPWYPEVVTAYRN